MGGGTSSTPRSSIPPTPSSPTTARAVCTMDDSSAYEMHTATGGRVEVAEDSTRTSAPGTPRRCMEEDREILSSSPPSRTGPTTTGNLGSSVMSSTRGTFIDSVREPLSSSPQ